MSWDIFVQDFPKEAKSVSDIPRDYKPGSIGKRAEIIRKIKEVVPNADFADATWGILKTENYLIEINIGKEENIDSFAFHVRGGSEAVNVIEKILNHLHLQAIDAQTGEFFDQKNAEKSFSKWRTWEKSLIHRTSEN